MLNWPKNRLCFFWDLPVFELEPTIWFLLFSSLYQLCVRIKKFLTILLGCSRNNSFLASLIENTISIFVLINRVECFKNDMQRNSVHQLFRFLFSINNDGIYGFRLLIHFLGVMKVFFSLG